jgi:hypothetical protein
VPWQQRLGGAWSPCLLTVGLAFIHARLCRADAFLVGRDEAVDGENVLLREVRRKAAAGHRG